jgi:pimeloyl-ACP methyl ester carboxylesterase
LQNLVQKRADIEVDVGRLDGTLAIPDGAKGLVLFAHGTGSGRLSPRNTFVAAVLRRRPIATLLFDLLTPAEDTEYRTRFDIELLTQRLTIATRWAQAQTRELSLPLGYFGASTGAAAALRAANIVGDEVRAIVTRGGRPDLAGGDELARVRPPTLLLVGGRDTPVIALNRDAFAQLRCEKQLRVVPGAGHLFDEPGTIEQVAQQAADWFEQHFIQRSQTGNPR